MRVLVTGGAGFIGSQVIRYLVLEKGYEVLTVDKLTYAGNLDSLRLVGTCQSPFFSRGHLRCAGHERGFCHVPA